ncbi:helix-turn-helix transcriptional regulator [Amphibacillus cookii]|uniref:helix-turn-helix transcriptional regulator n=1 Tax=Amphibacillus cookii TaxID=767787 RepID=UPI001958A4CF|nr:AraC family transcriptional regulator [Amphibacillus cookii]MBM7539815.1 AraC-like DNA-binding protein [Amphibacillus cookii]
MEASILLENRMHGDTMFPIRVYTVDYLDGEVIFNLHWHPEFEFLYLEEGEITFQVGTNHYDLKQGDICSIRCEELHGAYPVKGRSFKLHAIVFHLNLIKSFTFDLIDNEYLDHLHAIDFPPFKRLQTPRAKVLLQQLLDTYFNKAYGFEMEVKGYLYLILADLLRDNSQNVHHVSPEVANKLNIIKAIMQYVDNHLDQQITIAKLAEQAQMSEGHFSRFFKSIVRMTPIEYVNSVRINKACELLKKTDKKIIEVAMDVGFDNQSYFIRTFKKQRKCSPSQFRKDGIDIW